jgi:hypothetical protein
MTRQRRGSIRAQGIAPAQPRSASERWDRRWGRALRYGYLAAIALHFAVFLIFQSAPWQPPEEPRMPAMRAIDPIMAGGGGAMSQVEVSVVEPEEPVEEAPVEEVPVEPTPAEVEAPEVAEVDIALPGDRVGTDDRLGQFEGRGESDAVGDEAGRGGDEGRVTPPVPRGMILPPSGAPADARGREITVWVYVDARGRVVGDQTRLEPPTSDARYNRRLIASAAGWSFDPARQNGQPVAAWYPFEIIF